MSSTLKIAPKQKVFAETGSAFDTTNIERQVKVRSITISSAGWNERQYHHCHILKSNPPSSPSALAQVRAGGHDDLPSKKVDISAFSYSRDTGKLSPDKYLSKKTGNGGTMVPKPTHTPTAAEAARSASISREPKSMKFSAYAPRANPPNTELRRYAQQPQQSTIRIGFGCRFNQHTV
jgi:hypothetical protein